VITKDLVGEVLALALVPCTTVPAIQTPACQKPLPGASGVTMVCLETFGTDIGSNVLANQPDAQQARKDRLDRAQTAQWANIKVRTSSLAAAAKTAQLVSTKMQMRLRLAKDVVQVTIKDLPDRPLAALVQEVNTRIKIVKVDANLALVGSIRILTPRPLARRVLLDNGRTTME